MFHKSHITYFNSIISNLKAMQGCFTTTVILRYFPKREYTHGYSGLLYGHFMNKVNKRNPTILRFPNFNKLPVPVIGVIVPVFINLLVFTGFPLTFSLKFFMYNLISPPYLVSQTYTTT